MANEVEEFLRRAALKRAQAEAQLRAHAEARARQSPPPPAPPRTPPPRIAQLAPVDAEIIDPRHDVGDRVSPSVAQVGIGSHQMGQRAAHLSDRVEVVDAEMQAHMRQAFGHQVGRLTNAAAAAPPEAGAAAIASSTTLATAAATNLADLLKTPQNLRTAMILQEILRRPEELW